MAVGERRRYVLRGEIIGVDDLRGGRVWKALGGGEAKTHQVNTLMDKYLGGGV
ncbi:hypothetical protein HWV54_02955 [Bartonella alsatica]|uniref:Uncharacterized protein n=1 Tax=Bartonella alsatica TaxID=52764 RepID=A0ABX6QH05_9HYPH|nr:hypothetical protein [Bartonella alsatica]QLC51873.1 hypothetical protein HWV54_02955 [Bartonella alsatica]